MMPGILSHFHDVYPFVYSVDGRRLGPGHNAPTLSEVARGLGKICRFAGNSRVFWPVLLHSMVVADLVGEDAELYALLHDAAEVVFNDTPTPFKPAFFEAREAVVLRKLYEDLGVPQPSESILKRVKAADRAALLAEAKLVGPTGLSEFFGERDTHAEALVLKYLTSYQPADYLTEGKAVLTFKVCVQNAVDRIQGVA